MVPASKEPEAAPPTEATPMEVCMLPAIAKKLLKYCRLIISLPRSMKYVAVYVAGLQSQEFCVALRQCSR